MLGYKSIKIFNYLMVILFASSSFASEHSNEIGFDKSIVHQNTDRLKILDAIRLGGDCPCQNGKCVTENGAKVCKCNPEFGLYQAGICKACNCGLGANCTFDLGIFIDDVHCICPSGYKVQGQECIGTCNPNPCLNGGMCFQKDGKIKCDCGFEYFGDKCQEKKVDCSDAPCLNGGTCYDNHDALNGDQYTCICKQFYYGKNCEKTDSTSPQPTLRPTAEGSTTLISKSTFEEDPCFVNPCQNGGLCRRYGSTYKCFCPSPFFGKTCNSDPCSNSPCASGGICVVDGESHTCYCQHPFSGRNCEIGPCSDNPCKNEGTCRTVGNSFKCSCKAPYFGFRCEKDGCYNHQCKNGGLCKSNVLGFGYKCYCSSPFTGTRCEKGPCSDTPCKNGGICKVEGHTHRCFCRSPYSGNSCEIQEALTTPEPTKTELEKTTMLSTTNLDPCAVKPCQNGGTCRSTKDSYKCECPKEFTGKLCQTEKCKCKNGKCIEVGEELKCVCKPDYGIYSEGVCAACNCGENFSCSFDKGTSGDKIYCFCPEGYSLVERKCIKNKI